MDAGRRPALRKVVILTPVELADGSSTGVSPELRIRRFPIHDRAGRRRLPLRPSRRRTGAGPGLMRREARLMRRRNACFGRRSEAFPQVGRT